MGAPQTVQLQRFGYTAPDATVTGVQVGSWEWSGTNRAVQTFCAFDTGSGPAGGSFVARVLRNGATAMTITVLTGTDERVQVVSPAVQLVSGDLITFSIITVSGATGVVTLGFGYY
jgi:hypothetical protein